jgi:hypothetical protein
MRMRLLVPVLWLGLGSSSGLASSASPMPSAPEASDLDEVDDLADDDDILPRSAQGEKDVEARVARINKLQEKELRLSHDEIRAKHTYVGALALGSSKPWQAYDVELGYVVKPDRVASLFAGGGPQRFEGVVSEKSYDMKVDARTFGLTGRYFFHKIEGMSVEAVLGYAQWDGSVSPHGSDDSIDDASEKLSSSFHATGYFGGLSAALSWLWESGFYLEWTLVGITSGKVQTLDFTRDSDLVDKAVRRDLQRASFYGLNNLKLGMHF